jgi:hypothetical protein
LAGRFEVMRSSKIAINSPSKPQDLLPRKEIGLLLKGSVSILTNLASEEEGLASLKED